MSVANASTARRSRLAAQGLAALRHEGWRAALGRARQHLWARWQLRKATTVGTARLWGRAHVYNSGTLVIGDRVRLDGRALRLDLACFAPGRLEIGEGTYINYGSNISATELVSIGRNCAIGQFAIIMDNDYHDMNAIWEMGAPEPVVIEDDVWLGARCIVLRGARIGRGSVIGANSVVKGEIPPYSLAAGMPARVIRRLR